MSRLDANRDLWEEARRHCPEVTDADVAAAFGLPVTAKTIDHDFGQRQALFTLAGHQHAQVYVFATDHRSDLVEGGAEAGAWWPASDVTGTLAGLGDEAYLTRSGGVVARLGTRWTAGVRADATVDWSPTIDQSIDLLRRVVANLADEGQAPRGTTPSRPEPNTPWSSVPGHIEQRRRRRFGAGPTGVRHTARRRRTALAGGALLVAGLCALLSGGLLNQALGPAFGQPGRAEVLGDCHGFREYRCDAALTDSGGRLVDGAAALFSARRYHTADVVRVRYGDGKSVPDNVPERFRTLGLGAGFGAAAVAALVWMAAVLTGRFGTVTWRLAGVAVALLLAGLAAAFVLKAVSPSEVVGRAPGGSATATG